MDSQNLQRDTEGNVTAVLVQVTNQSRFVSLDAGASTGKSDALAYAGEMDNADTSPYFERMCKAVASSPDLFQEYINSYTEGDSGEAIQD